MAGVQVYVRPVHALTAPVCVLPCSADDALITNERVVLQTRLTAAASELRFHRDPVFACSLNWQRSTPVARELWPRRIFTPRETACAHLSLGRAQPSGTGYHGTLWDTALSGFHPRARSAHAAVATTVLSREGVANGAKQHLLTHAVALGPGCNTVQMNSGRRTSAAGSSCSTSWVSRCAN